MTQLSRVAVTKENSRSGKTHFIIYQRTGVQDKIQCFQMRTHSLYILIANSSHFTDQALRTRIRHAQ